MKISIKKFFVPGKRGKSVVLFVFVIACVILFGMQANRWIIASRTVTQTQIEAGWKAAGL